MKKSTTLLSLFVLLSCTLFAQIKNPQQLSYGWQTDTTKHSVPLSDLTVAAGKDVLPSLDFPAFIQKDHPAADFYEYEPVIALTINGESKAYPLSLLTMYELANDSIGGTQVMVTFCPMCNAAMVFDRKITVEGKERTLNFGISGLLMHNDMVMYDRETESWWEQIMGEGIVGAYAGTSLTMMNGLIISVKDYFDRHPDGLILSPEGLELVKSTEGHRPFYHLDQSRDTITDPHFIPEDLDPRLPPLERVVDIHLFDHNKIYPFSAIEKVGVLNELFYDKHFVIFYHGNVVSVMDEDELEKSVRTGSATVFYSDLDKVVYTFEVEGDYFRDTETGSRWDITGYCREGELKGKQLYGITHSNHYAFAYLAFFPECEIFGQ